MVLFLDPQSEPGRENNGCRLTRGLGHFRGGRESLDRGVEVDGTAVEGSLTDVTEGLVKETEVGVAGGCGE